MIKFIMCWCALYGYAKGGERVCLQYAQSQMQDNQMDTGRYIFPFLTPEQQESVKGIEIHFAKVVKSTDPVNPWDVVPDTTPWIASMQGILPGVVTP